MKQSEIERFDESRTQIRMRYRQLALFISKRLKDIDAEELILPVGLDNLYHHELIKQYGSSTKKGMLQDELNKCFGGILTDLKKDFPYFTRQQIQVFSLIAAGIPYYMVARLSGLASVNSVWIEKGKMKSIISTSGCRRKEEYILLLER